MILFGYKVSRLPKKLAGGKIGMVCKWALLRVGRNKFSYCRSVVTVSSKKKKNYNHEICFPTYSSRFDFVLISPSVYQQWTQNFSNLRFFET